MDRKAEEEPIAERLATTTTPRGPTRLPIPLHGGRAAGWGFAGPGLVRRVQAHRPVFDPALLQQRYLVNTRLQQGAPVLPEPALGVALATEGLLRHVAGACRCPV